MELDLRAGSRDTLRIKLASFEGPLDLLLHLIKRDEIDIYDIPIAHITRHYLDMIEAMQILDLEVAGEFLVMAATLMRIKARLLLPPSPLEPEEGGGDPRAELVQRLLEYRTFKEVSLTLRDREEHRALVHGKGYVPRVESNEPLPLKPISLFQLIDALRGALARGGGEHVHEVVLPPVSTEEKMEELRADLVAAWGQIRFAEVILRCRTRIEIIATFMALLELIKLGEVAARQYEEFGEIWLFTPERLAGVAVESAALHADAPDPLASAGLIDTASDVEDVADEAGMADVESAMENDVAIDSDSESPSGVPVDGVGELEDRP
jgi:segregation and condensation protein A